MRRFLFLPLALAALPVLAAATPPEEETEHVVKAGETLGGVAARAQVPRILIAEANGLREPYALRAGQKLRIPRTRRHTVAAGETGFAIAYKYGITWRTIATANHIAPDAAVRPGQVLLIPTVIAPPTAATTPATSPVAKAHATQAGTPAAPATPAPGAAQPPATLAWPVNGPVRRGFAPRGAASVHDGIDVTAAAGTAVRASAAGRVIFAGQGPREYGLTVIVHHGQRWTTVYGFLGRVTVKEGDRVAAGERIGLAGQTGLAKGPELHFEVRRAREALDPVAYLPRTPAR